MPDYQTFRILRWCLHCPQVLTGNFLLLFLNLSCTTNQGGGNSIWVSPSSPGSEASVSCTVFSGDDNSNNPGVLIAEEVHRMQNKGSGYKTTVDAEHSWRPFPPCPWDPPDCQCITATRVSASDYRNSTVRSYPKETQWNNYNQHQINQITLSVETAAFWILTLCSEICSDTLVSKEHDASTFRIEDRPKYGLNWLRSGYALTLQWNGTYVVSQSCRKGQKDLTLLPFLWRPEFSATIWREPEFWHGFYQLQL